jgi:hypothetical protein
MSTRPIYLLPAALREYQVESVGSAPDEECYVCYRVYGEKDDEDNPNEKPYVTLC